MQHPVLDTLRERVLVYDGAFGTYVQGLDLGPDDFGGDALEGCNEILAVTRPHLIAGLHQSYFDVGCDITETATFGAFSVPLDEYDIGDRAHEINLAAARIAKEVAADYATADRPKFVAGSIGPGTKMPTLGHISFTDLRDSYEIQALALLEGGVDLFLVETQYDLLGLKAAVIACRRAMRTLGREIPIQAQVTIETTGTMLPGTEIGAALSAIDALRVDIVGLNCATGPAEMSEHVRHLSQHSRMPISVIPNAGLPSVVDGRMHYDLSPQDVVDHLTRFVTEFGVQVVGGCCGTGPDYIKALVEQVGPLTPAARNPEHIPGAASIYSFQPFEQDASLLLIGERTNANGSKKFREAMLDGDIDTMSQMATEQIAEGSHVLDLCVDYVGRDGAADMDSIAYRFATQSTVPIMLDSTEPEVIEAGLQRVGGRVILNSVNLEDGDAEGTRFDRFLTMAREYGAAVVCTTIDEEGQARDRHWKLRAAQAIHDLAVERYGLEASDLIFDPLALTLSTGIEESRKDGIETIEGIRLIKQELPGVHTTLGLSNISFGLKPSARHVLNSVFLNECMQAGLDSAIVHAGKIVPISKIADEQRDVCLDLIYDRRGADGLLAHTEDDPADYDPLAKLLDIFADVETVKAVKEDRTDWPVTERLSARIIDGDRNGLVDDLEEARTEGLTALEIINDHLLAGMKIVGERFGAGEMQLPFVLQSAETMKAAVGHLEQYMEKVDGDSSKGRVVLATVKGDVHDIGKNLVDIILTNNGYDVFNLGIKVSIADMIAKAEEVEAHAIGMSGLLVKSTLIMRDNLAELNARNLYDIPVILGGAALTRSYVERDLRGVYDGRVFYGRDAFEGLHTMDRLGAIRRGDEPDDPDWGAVPSESTVRARAGIAPREEQDPVDLPDRSPAVTFDDPIPTPPFWGSQVVKGIALDDIAEFVNETALFRNQWQFRPNQGEADADFKDRIRPQLRQQLAAAKADGLLQPQVVYGYFPANADGNDLVIWSDTDRTAEVARFSYPRQRVEPFLCIADFFRPVDGPLNPDGVVDVAAFHIVTMGAPVSARAAELFAADKYQDYLMLHGIGVEMAEALAELWHKRIRQELAIDDGDDHSLAGLFRQKYHGGRYSWGYPACPDLEDNETVARLLDASRIGIEVSEDTGYQFQPEQSTSALICHHRRAKYFVAR